MTRFRFLAAIALSFVTFASLTSHASSDTTTTLNPPFPTLATVTTTVRIPGPPRAHHAWVPRILPTPTKWIQTGPGTRFPDKTDPTRFLAPVIQHAFQCIRYHESRDHLVDGTPGSAGWYQFTSSTWHSAAVALGFSSRLMWDANLATSDQQSAVAVWYWHRNARFGVQWGGDYYFGCYPASLR